LFEESHDASVPHHVEEEEGLHGVFKRLRRNGHQLKKEAANSSTLTVTHRRLNPMWKDEVAAQHTGGHAQSATVLPAGL
jgi:hypothetical protein